MDTTSASGSKKDPPTPPPPTPRGLRCIADMSVPPRQIGDGPHRLTYTEHQPAWHCDFSPDGTYLAVAYGAPHPCVRLWHCLPNNEWQLLPETLEGVQTRTIRAVAFAPIQRPLTLASASFDGTLAIWEQTEKNDWDCVAQLEGHDNECKCVIWNASGTLLASCGRDKSVWVWECFLTGAIGGRGPSESADFECIAVLNGHEADVKCVVFAPSHDQWGDGDEILLSGSYDDTVRVWAEDAGDWFCAFVIKDFHSSTIWSIAVAPSGNRIITASADRSIGVCKAFSSAEMKAEQDSSQETDQDPRRRVKPAWKCVGKLPEAHNDTIYYVDCALARIGHGRIVSCGADNTIQIYCEAMESSPNRPIFHRDCSQQVNGSDLHCVKWHPWKGELLASVGDDGHVRLWHFDA
jgi:cytosolic iron-sulfur protein assembly protein CIAO1